MKTVKDLYYDYKKELWGYTGETYTKEEVDGWFDSMFTDPSIKIVPIVQFGKPVGFVIYQDIKWKVQKYIVDAYVVPEKRRQGLMKQTIETLLCSQLIGDICLYVIKDNEAAVTFWDRFFTEKGYFETVSNGLPGFEDDDRYNFLIFSR